MLILPQRHRGIQACIPSLATMSGGDGMDSVLEYMLPNVCGLRWPCSIMTGA
jgi:hypothetical protein